MPYEEIVDRLLKGGLVISERQSGKTRALAVILKYDPNAVVVSGLQSQRSTLLKYCKDLNVEGAEDRVFSATKPLDALFLCTGSRVYLDEVGYCPREWIRTNSHRIWAGTASVGPEGTIRSLFGN